MEYLFILINIVSFLAIDRIISKKRVFQELYMWISRIILKRIKIEPISHSENQIVTIYYSNLRFDDDKKF